VAAFHRQQAASADDIPPSIRVIGNGIESLSEFDAEFNPKRFERKRRRRWFTRPPKRKE
jgi:hypothetical protein